MMSLMNLGLIWGPLVHTLVVIFLYVLKSQLLMFCIWCFCNNRNQIQRWSTCFNIFALELKFGISVPNFKISFIVLLYIVWHCISKWCYLSYIIIRRSPMGDVWRPYDSGIRACYSRIFIQYVNGREPMDHELWSSGFDGLNRDVYLTAQVEIPTRTSG